MVLLVRGAETWAWFEADVGVWPGREVGVYSVVWLAVGATAGYQPGVGVDSHLWVA